MAGVTATDTEDGNLTTKIEVKKNEMIQLHLVSMKLLKVTDNQGIIY